MTTPTPDRSAAATALGMKPTEIRSVESISEVEVIVTTLDGNRTLVVEVHGKVACTPLRRDEPSPAPTEKAEAEAPVHVAEPAPVIPRSTDDGPKGRAKR